jgi:hypothetical protein
MLMLMLMMVMIVLMTPLEIVKLESWWVRQDGPSFMTRRAQVILTTEINLAWRRRRIEKA